MTDMLQKSENVAKNVANENSQDLTEQWKKGELPEGYYWVKVKEELANYPILADCVRRYEYYDVYTYFPEYEDSITSVLAPVPSYEEYEQLENWNRFTADYHALREAKEIAEYENAELKETVEALKSELKEVCDVLIRKCPEMKDWVMMNWKNLYEVQDDEKA